MIPRPTGRTSTISRLMIMTVRALPCSYFDSSFAVTGQDTLHGGIYGWDRRNWTIAHKSSTSVTYQHLDAADEGFPGNVTVYVSRVLYISVTRHPYSPLSGHPLCSIWGTEDSRSRYCNGGDAYHGDTTYLLVCATIVSRKFFLTSSDQQEP